MATSPLIMISTARSLYVLFPLSAAVLFLGGCKPAPGVIGEQDNLSADPSGLMIPVPLGNREEPAAHKIVIRQIGTEPTATLITEPFAVTANIFTVRAASLAEEKYLLAIINSKLTAYFWRTMFADFKASFPQVTIFSLSQVPVWKIDFSKPADKTRHDKLVVLVDKLLGLMPKLRAATSDSEKATLQNAVTATDQQIDALVYDLYGLTAAEIALVEGNP